MLTKQTAHDIFFVCQEAEECKKALALFQEEDKPGFNLVSFDKNHVPVFNFRLPAKEAKEALEKRLCDLEAHYKAFNEKAIEEIKQ